MAAPGSPGASRPGLQEGWSPVEPPFAQSSLRKPAPLFPSAAEVPRAWPPRAGGPVGGSVAEASCLATGWASGRHLVGPLGTREGKGPVSSQGGLAQHGHARCH